MVFQDKDLESAFQLFVTCRAQNGQKLTEEQIILLREELLKKKMVVHIQYFVMPKLSLWGCKYGTEVKNVSITFDSKRSGIYWRWK